jgi:hypothetical protein
MAHGKSLSLRRAIDRGYNSRTARLVFGRRQHLSPAGTKATLTTALVGANNDLVFTAVQPGADGNSISVAYVNAGGTTPLSVDFQRTANGPVRAVVVTLATTTGTITSTAAQVRDAVNGHPRAQNHVQAANAAANDGTGVVTALAATNLTGGTG